MKTVKWTLITALVPCILAILWAGNTPAHFAMIIPSSDVVEQPAPKELVLDLQFTHPFAGGPQMQMDKPRKFGVIFDDKKEDLLPNLSEKKKDGKSVWQTKYSISKPADYVFFLEPAPYWEPTEDKYIVHYTKVIVDAFGAEQGWDQSIAKAAQIPVEIIPLSRPYSLYSGNVFSGQVMKNGEPVSGAEIEIEWWGKGQTKAPTDSHITQLTKADKNGVFHFGLPKAGWWGFSAIMDSDQPMKKDGEDKKVETAAVIWVYAHSME